MKDFRYVIGGQPKKSNPNEVWIGRRPSQGTSLTADNINIILKYRLKELHGINLYNLDKSLRFVKDDSLATKNIVLVNATNIDELNSTNPNIRQAITKQLPDNDLPTSYIIPVNINSSRITTNAHWVLTILDTDGKGNWSMRYIDPETKISSYKTNKFGQKIFNYLSKNTDKSSQEFSQPMFVNTKQYDNGEWEYGFIMVENACSIAMDKQFKANYTQDDIQKLQTSFQEVLDKKNPALDALRWQQKHPQNTAQPDFQTSHANEGSKKKGLVERTHESLKKHNHRPNASKLRFLIEFIKISFSAAISNICAFFTKKSKNADEEGDKKKTKPTVHAQEIETHDLPSMDNQKHPSNDCNNEKSCKTATPDNNITKKTPATTIAMRTGRKLTHTERAENGLSGMGGIAA
ncbi:MAG: hypothetical protein K0R98_908 [Rickettsiaceae bacterium]|jgi:hypothetical protein|nr:hypothetical protein [Rickettsiaceae bacterium]